MLVFDKSTFYAALQMDFLDPASATWKPQLAAEYLYDLANIPEFCVFQFLLFKMGTMAALLLCQY